MKVSIIIPIYNVSKYIIRCLDSVTSQTFRNIECILVDDCGTDNSVVIAENYIKEYHGPVLFRIIHHKYNRGLSAARNTGIDAAQGDYIFFLDSDDTIVKDCIETLYSLFEKYPDIEFAQGNVLGEDGNISPYGFKHYIPEHTDDKELIFRIMLSQITTTAWNRLILRSFVLEHKLYFPEGYFTEDMYWGYFIAKYAHSVSFTPKGLYVYYINEGSMMTAPANHIKWYTSRIWTSWQYLEDMERYGSNKYQRQYLAINLLSCLPELKALKSARLWLQFWQEVCSIAWAVKSHITLYRCIFSLCILPPLCFLAANNSLRWRIQQKVITNL